MLSTPLPSPRLLIADDNRDGADIIAGWLRAKGFDVQVAYDGPSAVELALHFDPAVLILDFDMPGLTGIEVANRLRALPQFKRRIFIALTGRCEPSDLELAAEVPFDEYFVKPCKLNSLMRVLQTN
jgi:CheY-like chemotaxis protein